MAPSDYRPSRRRTLWTSIRSFSCFSTHKTGYRISLSTDSLTLLAEKVSLQPSVPAPKPTRTDSDMSKPLPPSPPRLTRWPSAHNLKVRRSVLNVSEVHDADLPPADERTEISSLNGAGTTPDDELTDQLSLMDTANMLGAVGGVVGAGYAGAAYHQQRKHGKEEGRKEEDIEMGLRRSQVTQAGGSVESRGANDREGGVVEVATTTTTTESTNAYGWTGMR